MKAIYATLIAAGLLLQADPAAAFAGYYFNESNDQLYGFCTDGSCAPTVVYTPVSNGTAAGRVFAIDVDVANGHVYWAKAGGSTHPSNCTAPIWTEPTTSS